MSNLYGIIVGCNVQNGDKKAMISDNIAYSYADLLHNSLYWSNFFLENGIVHSTKVAVLVDNPAVFVFVLLGILRVGAIAVPIDTASKTYEVQKICADLAIKNMVVMDNLIDQVDFPEVNQVFHTINTGKKVQIKEQVFDHSCIENNLHGEALYLTTSGTTGKAKYVIHSLHSILNAALVSNKAYKSNDADVVFNAAPVFHSAGLMPVLAALDSNATCIMMSKFLPKTFLRMITEFQPNIVKAPAFMYRIISQMPPPKGIHLAFVKQWYTGSSKLLTEEKQRIKKKYAFKVLEMYATSETSLIAVELASGNNEIEEPTVIQVVDTIDVKIDDEGKILVSTPAIALAYMESGSDKKIYPDKFVFSGDLGRMVGENQLIIEGRESNRINIAGKKISADEINNVLALNPNITESYVFGINNNSSDDEIVACIIPKEDMLPEEVTAHCRKYLSGYKVPKYIYFYKTFPKGKLGKIAINKLKEEIYEQLYS